MLDRGQAQTGERGFALAQLALPLLAVALTASVYWRTAHTYFWADDFRHLFTVFDRGASYFVFKAYAGHLSLARNLVFWLTWRLGGFDPRPYYWSALATHLVNVWLAYRVGRATTGNDALACLAAVAWGTSFLGIGTVGWYSVYGHELVATLLLVVLDRVFRTPDGAVVSGRRFAGWCLLLLVGTTCFGVGVGIAMAFPAALALVHPQLVSRGSLRVGLLTFPVVVVAVYLGGRRLSDLVGPPAWMESIYTQAAFSSPWQILAMWWHLTAFGISGLLLGSWFVADDYPGPLTAFATALYATMLLLGAAAGGRAVARRLLAFVGLSLAAYGMIAIGRANLYVMFHTAPSVSARSGQYHYAGVVPLSLALATALSAITRRAAWLRPLVLGLWLLGFTAGVWRNPWRVDEHVFARRWAEQGLGKIEEAVDAARPGDPVTIENEEAPRTVLGPMMESDGFPGLVALFALAYPENVVRGHPVRFVERHPGTYFMLRDPSRNARLRDLVVSPDVVDTHS